MKKTLAVVVLLGGFVGRSSAGAADPRPPREITVSGSAEVKVAPDQAVLTLAVETSDKDIGVAKAQNDERVKKVIDVALKQFRVEPKHVQTDQITVEPRYRDNDRLAPPVFMGYWVRKQIVIVMKDLSKFEALLTAVLKAGTNYVPGVEFQSTSLRKHRDAARSMAMKAAIEKATALAKEVGQKIGKPLSINENAGYYGFGYGRSQNSNFSQNVMSSGPSGAAESPPDDGFAPGQISVRADVTVRFELE